MSNERCAEHAKVFDRHMPVDIVSEDQCPVCNPPRQKYPDYIMNEVRQRIGLEASDTSQDEYIEYQPKAWVFEKYLQWNGIMGYGNMIMEAIQDIWGVDIDTEGTEDE